MRGGCAAHPPTAPRCDPEKARRRPGLTMEPGAPPERGPRARPAGHLSRELAARWSGSQRASHQRRARADVKILIARGASSPPGHRNRAVCSRISVMRTRGEASAEARADLHCHSTASAVSRLGVQRALGLPECATPPQEVYELAKRRGMDFVTITDHDTIDGALALADLPDAFISVELTARFRGEPQAVHVLCFGHHARGPRVAAGARGRRRGVRRVPRRAAASSARSPTRSTRSPRRSRAATAAASPSCSRSGRRATARARRS